VCDGSHVPVTRGGDPRLVCISESGDIVNVDVRGMSRTRTRSVTVSGCTTGMSVRFLVSSNLCVIAHSVIQYLRIARWTEALLKDLHMQTCVATNS
jgi:hypothetical protein